MNILKINSIGDDVKTLQQYLKNVGYDLVADGNFGPHTLQIVIQFQSSHGLAADGIVGPATWNFINAGVVENIIEGIDISYYNGNIDFDKVAQTQTKFVICKASEGQSIIDAKFASYFSELQRVNIIRGAYHFYRFFTDPISQANNFLAKKTDYTLPGVLPPFIDVEYQDSHGTTNATIQQNAKKYSNELLSFLTEVENKTGRKPIIYTQKSFWDYVLMKPTGFENYLLWAVDYNNAKPVLASGWNNWKFWQYKDSGTISGINSKVDSNKFNGTIDELKKLANIG